VIGSLAMALADVRESSLGGRSVDDFGMLDGLALGLAQGLALAPGISRNGATLAAARALGYGRREAQTLSWRAGLPVILGASGLECARLLRGGPRGSVSRLGLGAAAAFLSTRALAGPLGAAALRGRRLVPYSVYRCLLGAAVVVRLRRAQ
jgi:undecaprenyl-diphosphatase